jgi:hypothetical protein
MFLISSSIQVKYFRIAALVLICASYSKAQVVTNGRVAYYSFNGNSNDQVSSINGIVHGAQLSEDRFGNILSAFSFDGIDDYIEIPDNELLDFSYSKYFTISLWVYIDSDQKNLNGSGNEVLSKWNAITSSSYPYAIRYLNKQSTEANKNKVLSLRYDSEICVHNPYIIGNCPLTLDNWNHLVLIKQGNMLSYFQNGMLFGQTVDNTNC